MFLNLLIHYLKKVYRKVNYVAVNRSENSIAEKSGTLT